VSCRRSLLEALLLAELKVLNTLALESLGDELAEESLHERTSDEHAARSLLESTSLDGLGDERHPSVEFTLTKTSERLTKGHVANDVESGEVYNTSQIT
jgi:hypothetical protein